MVGTRMSGCCANRAVRVVILSAGIVFADLDLLAPAEQEELPRQLRAAQHHVVHVVAPSDRPGGAPLDEVVVFTMPGPHSYTGEDVVEMQRNGYLELLLTAALRPAMDAVHFPPEIFPLAVLRAQLDVGDRVLVHGATGGHPQRVHRVGAAGPERGRPGRREGNRRHEDHADRDAAVAILNEAEVLADADAVARRAAAFIAASIRGASRSRDGSGPRRG